MRILIADTGLREVSSGPMTEARHIPRKHVKRRFTLDDPLGGQFAHTTVLAEAGNNPVATKISRELWDGAEQNVGIRGPNHRTIDDAFDPSLTDGWHAFYCTHHVVFDAFKVVCKELVSKSLRCAVLGPEANVFFIGPDQKAFAFLTQIIFAISVRDGG